MLKVRDIMTSRPITVTPDTSLRNAMELFTHRHISGAPVCDAGKLVGVISSSDLLAFAASPPENARTPAAEGQFDELSGIEDDGSVELADDALSDGAFFTDLLNDADTDVDVRFAALSDPTLDVLDEYTVAHAMTAAVRTIGPDESATAAARLMRQVRVHRLVVMEDGHLAGIISTTDLNRAAADRGLRDTTPIAETRPDFDSGWTHEPVVWYDDQE